MRIHTQRLVPMLVMVGLTAVLTGCSQVTTTTDIDEQAVSYLETQTQTNVSSVIETLNALEEERNKPVIPPEEHLSAEEIRAHLASGKRATGVLTPYKVTTLADSEVPKLRALFSDTIIIGNSRAKSILQSGLLSDNEVLFKWAAHVDDIMDITIQAANLYRGKVLFIMGVNDLGYYCANTDGFKEDYAALIDAYREINPNGEIYLQEIIPVNEAYRYRWYNMDRVGAYNEVIRELCAEKDCGFVSSVQYALEEFLVDDKAGVHYDYRYHLYWAQTMANQMGLWEEYE
ncbi:MAG: hypothetical protein IJA07_01370 [Agathobacter sp.]|nr:hypothetical protein [Agathobacter sp.]